MKILVTGGAGYIGSQAVLSLIKLNYDVVVFDSLERGFLESLKAISRYTSKEIPFIHGDLKIKEDISKVFVEHPDISVVMHFAAYAQVGESVLNPLKYYDNNTGGTINLLNAMLQNGVKKIVFSSTAATYGLPDVELVKEDTPQRPINPYGKSKLMVEDILNDLYVSDTLSSIRLRYFNVAGASHESIIGEAHNPESHLIPNVLFAAMGKKEKLVIFGNDYQTFDGTCVRDYIHVEDLIEAHILAIEKLEQIQLCEYINLGSKNGFSNMQVVNACKEVTGKDFPVEIGARRAGDPDKLIADSTKAHTVLGWYQKTSLNEMIASAWKWQSHNPEGYTHNDTVNV